MTTEFVTSMVGLCAGTLTTFSFVPQVMQIWKTRRADDVSLGMFVIFSVGVFLWLIYGIKIHSVPVIISNVVTLVLSLSVLILKIRCPSTFRPEKRQVPPATFSAEK